MKSNAGIHKNWMLPPSPPPPPPPPSPPTKKRDQNYHQDQYNQRKTMQEKRGICLTSITTAITPTPAAVCRNNDIAGRSDGTIVKRWQTTKETTTIPGYPQKWGYQQTIEYDLVLLHIYSTSWQARFTIMTAKVMLLITSTIVQL